MPKCTVIWNMLPAILRKEWFLPFTWKRRESSEQFFVKRTKAKKQLKGANSVKSAQIYQMALNRWFWTQLGETTLIKREVIWGPNQNKSTFTVNEAPQSETWGHMHYLDASPVANEAPRSKDDENWGQLHCLKTSPAMNEAPRSENDNNTWGHMQYLDASPVSEFQQDRKDDTSWGHLQYLDTPPANEIHRGRKDDTTWGTLQSLEMPMEPVERGQLPGDKI